MKLCYLSLFVCLTTVTSHAAEPTPAVAAPVRPGTLLLTRDFADGQLGMIIHNTTPGAKAAVVDVDGQKAVQVTIPFALRVNRHQLQFFLDQHNIDQKLGGYYLVTLEHRDGTPHGLAIAPDMFPLWDQNVPKAGQAKLVLSRAGPPDDKGWRQVQYLYQFSNDAWDGYLLQFRLLFFRDNAENDITYEGFFRRLELRQLTEAQAAGIKAQ